LTTNNNEFLSTRNLKWGGGLFAFLFIAFGLAFSWQSWRTEKAGEIQHLSVLAELGEKALGSYFYQLERALDLLSRDLLDKDGRFDAQRVKFLLKRFIEVHTELSDISVVRLDGQILVTGKSASGAALSRLKWLTLTPSSAIALSIWHSSNGIAFPVQKCWGKH
jgi:hypothetical protein